MMSSPDPPTPVDFPAWIASVRHLLQPPVGNKLLFGKGLHKVMVVGGPNVRRDYHIEDGEELFFQLEGDMSLEVRERGEARAVPIREGEIFLLPGRIPHSPQRLAGTVGLVLERERRAAEVDGLRWYTPGDGGRRVLYEETFHCTDLGSQLGPVIGRYFASPQHASGEPAPGFDESASPVRIDDERGAGSAVNLREWAAAHASGGRNAVLYGPGAVEPEREGRKRQRRRAGAGAAGGAGGDGDGIGDGADAGEDGNSTFFEYKVEVKSGPDAGWGDGGWVRVSSSAAAAAAAGVAAEAAAAGGGVAAEAAEAAGAAVSRTVSEVFFYQLEGRGTVELRPEGDGGLEGDDVAPRVLDMPAGHVLVVPPGFLLRARWEVGCLALVVTNSAGLA